MANILPSAANFDHQFRIVFSTANGFYVLGDVWAALRNRELEQAHGILIWNPCNRHNDTKFHRLFAPCATDRPRNFLVVDKYLFLNHYVEFIFGLCLSFEGGNFRNLAETGGPFVSILWTTLYSFQLFCKINSWRCWYCRSGIYGRFSVAADTDTRSISSWPVRSTRRQ